MCTHRFPVRHDAGLTRVEAIIAVVVIAIALLLLLAILMPTHGGHGYSRVAATHVHLRSYAMAHQVYATDHGSLPGFSLDHNVHATEVGIFDSPAAPLPDRAYEFMAGGFADRYVGDPSIFTSPADPMTRLTPAGAGPGGRYGHMLVPDEDSRAVGATFSRLYFDPEHRPDDYVLQEQDVFITVAGTTHGWTAQFQSITSVADPSTSVDLVEEDEASILDNSMFEVLAERSGRRSLLASRHHGSAGHLAFFDGHVELRTDIVNRYTNEEDDAAHIRFLWNTYNP
ncbi:MAG: hypothetical protein KAS72_04955 [Phycisphaerales bacterium]|nr:hypothetical protein [Phycisphaerales bacterium]